MIMAAVDEHGALVQLGVYGKQIQDTYMNSAVPDAQRCAEVMRQLDEYFGGQRHEFTLQLTPEGTPFQQQVWAELLRIPYGTTISYQQLAERVGKPNAVRAVGRANGTNRIAIIIPCHRVIGSDGSLTGYGGGIDLKVSLLRHEGLTVVDGRKPRLADPAQLSLL
jgi:methylated-DNA-[protein]-cysteine S-methyltransferase